MAVSDIDFDYVAQLRHEYMNEFLDSQMLIEDRIKFAGEIPKLLGNFDRLLREVHEIYGLLANATHDPAADADTEVRCCRSCEAFRRLADLASAWPEMRNPE